MVSIEQVNENGNNHATPPSRERLLDAQEIESLLTHMKRPTAKMQLESLAKKLRKESQALERLEKSQSAASSSSPAASTPGLVGIEHDPATETSTTHGTVDEDMPLQQPTSVPPVTNSEPTAAAASNATTTIPGSTTTKYIPIDTFAFDSGRYNSPTVTIYISLEGVKELPRDQITCDFTPTSFDVIVRGLKNKKDYRLFKDNLAHNIDPATSKLIVKKDRLVVKLGKVKGEYGYDTWTDLIDKKGAFKKKKNNGAEKEDPHSSIMNLMKDLYESGDDNMRKVIGETMEKQRRGELGKDDNDMREM